MTRRYRGMPHTRKGATVSELIKDQLRGSNAPGSRVVEDLQDQVRVLSEIVVRLVQLLDDKGVMTAEETLNVVGRDWYYEDET